MKTKIFHAKFLFLLLGLIGFANMKAADPIVLTAEDAIQYKVQTQDCGSWTAYFGPCAHGTYLEWDVVVATAGTYDLTLQYATTSDKRMLLKINNQIPTLLYIGSADYSSGAYVNDGTKTIQAYLDAGDNTIVISAFQNAGKDDYNNVFLPYFDQITITSSATNVAKLPDEFSVPVLGQETNLMEGNWVNLDFWDTGFHGVGVAGDYSGYVEYEVDIPNGEEGYYNMVIDYAGGYIDDVYMNVVVNESSPDEFTCQLKVPGSGADGSYIGWEDLLTYRAMTQFYLPAGANFVRFVQNTNNGEYPNIAQLEFVRYKEYSEVVPEFPKVIKAGDATTFNKMQMDNRTGLNGPWTAYSGPPAHGAYIEWIVPILTAGTYDLTLQYATGADRAMTLNVNSQEPTLMYFGEDDYSSDWNTNDGTKTFTVYLDAGNDTIRMSALQLTGMIDDANVFTPVLDQFTITPSTMNFAKLPDEFSMVIPAQNTTARSDNWLDIDFPETGFEGVATGDNTGGYLEYDVTIPEGKDGLYNLVINYACGWDNHWMNLIVNEDSETEFTDELEVPGSGPDTWGDAPGWEDLVTYQAMVQFYLPAGANSIKFIENTDYSAYPNISQLKLFRYGEYAEATGIVSPKIVPDEGVSVYGLSNVIVISSSNSANYTIYDITGKVIASGISSANEKEISIASGIYIVKVNNVVKKVIVR